MKIEIEINVEDEDPITILGLIAEARSLIKKDLQQSINFNKQKGLLQTIENEEFFNCGTINYTITK